MTPISTTLDSEVDDRVYETPADDPTSASRDTWSTSDDVLLGETLNLSDSSDTDTDTGAARTATGPVAGWFTTGYRRTAAQVPVVARRVRAAAVWLIHAAVFAARQVAIWVRDFVQYVRTSPRKPLIVAGAVVVALAASVVSVVAASAKSVTITVDGQVREVTTLADTVDGALSSAGIELGTHDALAPAASTEISDGSAIVVARGRTFTAVVDGVERTGWTTSDTVAGALTELGLEPASFELSSPADMAIPLDGLAVTASTLYDVTLSLDGPSPTMALAAARSTSSLPSSLTTTATTVGELLTREGITVQDNQKLTPDADTPLRDGLAISIVTLPGVTLTVGAADAEPLYTDADTVADLLAANEVELRDEDTVEPALDTEISDGLDVTVTRISYRTSTEYEEIAQPADKQVSDPAMKAGKTKVTQEGHPGKEAVEYRTKVTNGVAGEPEEISRETITEARPTITAVGTKSTAPASTGSSGSGGVNWDLLAQCESGQRWNINTGNGYYGGLQFNTGTWLSNGGGKYAPRADLATREQQIEIATKLYKARGNLGAWPACSNKYGSQLYTG